VKERKNHQNRCLKLYFFSFQFILEHHRLEKKINKNKKKKEFLDSKQQFCGWVGLFGWKLVK
jgi:UDP-N-acetylglucosamine pyrophosphorylase